LAPNKKNRMQWILVLILGIIAVAVGVFLNFYAIVVVESSPFPAKACGFQISGFFFIGLGLGYMILTPFIRQLETKIKKMEEALP
jgi:uncharacterized membrane protein